MKTNVFKILMGIAGLYHAVLAAAGLVLPAESLSSLIEAAFGMTLDPAVLGSAVIKFAAAYMLAFSAVLLLLARDPVQYRGLAVPALILFGCRLINRAVLFGALTAGGMPVARNILGTLFLAVFAGALLLFLFKKPQAA